VLKPSTIVLGVHDLVRRWQGQQGVRLRASPMARRILAPNRGQFGPFAVCISTAPSGPTHLESWPRGLNSDSFFFTIMKITTVQINIVQINTPQINSSITIIMGKVNIHTIKFELTT
jgi:hypothetical protein